MKKHISSTIILIAGLFQFAQPLMAQKKRELIIIADSSVKINREYWKDFSSKIEKLNDSLNADLIGSSDESEFGMTRKVFVDSQSLLVNVKIFQNKTTLRIRKSEKPANETVMIRKIEFKTDKPIFEDDSKVDIYLEDTTIKAPRNPNISENADVDFQDEMEELKVEMENLSKEMEKVAEEKQHNSDEYDEIFDYPNSKKRKKVRFITTDTRFSVGFLQMQPTEPSTTQIHYNTIPELNNGKSLNWGFQHNWGINLIRGKLRLWNGISYDIQNYRFANNQVRLTPNNSEFKYFLEDPTSSGNVASNRSKLISHYIGMPIALGFQNKSRNPSFQLRVGVQGGYLVHSYSKVEFENNNKIKHYDDFNLNHFSLQPFALIQYENIAIYARYSMMDVFKKNEGLSNARTMSFGISIGG
jgi:hypothetical protein